MKRLRVFFATILLLLFFPFWRFLDYQVVTFPAATLYALFFLSISAISIILPLRLLLPQVKKLHFFAGWLLFGILVWWGAPLSDKATRHYELRHCGLSTFTGLFYNVRGILPPAHADDLEVRNQLCWIRKMIRRAPEEITDLKELQNYLDLIRQKLLSPAVKYKASLPLIALLHGNMSATLSGNALENVQVGKMFVDALHFWKGQYTTEISEFDYPWYAYPHAWFTQFEYGLIEKNWESIVEGIRIEEN